MALFVHNDGNGSVQVVFGVLWSFLEHVGQDLDVLVPVVLHLVGTATSADIHPLSLELDKNVPGSELLLAEVLPGACKEDKSYADPPLRRPCKAPRFLDPRGSSAFP